MMVVRAIIFDRDGVLCFFDVKPFASICEDLGISMDQIQNLWHKASVGKIDVDSFWDHVSSTIDLSEEDQDKLRNFDVNICVQLYADVENTMAILSKQEIKIGVLSDFSVPLQIESSLLPLRTYIDVVVSTAHLGYQKPDYRAYYTTLKELGVEAKECMFIDDEMPNVQGALEIGMKSIYLNRDALIQPLSEFILTMINTEPIMVRDGEAIPINSLCFMGL